MSEMSVLSIIFAILSGAACIMLVPAMRMHIGKRNLALSSLAIELLILNGFNLTNVLIWSGSNIDGWWNGSGLCDLEVKLYLAFGQSIIGIVASIFKQLADIFDTNNMTLSPTSSGKRNRRMFDACMIFMVPGLVMALHYLVQPTRYAISRFSGCRVTWDASWPSVVLLWIWYPLACGVCLFYTFLTVLRLLQHRNQVTSILQHSPKKTNKSWFVRLLTLSTILVVFFTPFAAYFFIFNITAGIDSRYSWKSIHPSGWAHHIPMDADSNGIAIDRWAQAIAGILVFLFFGIDKKSLGVCNRLANQIRLWPNVLQHG